MKDWRYLKNMVKKWISIKESSPEMEQYVLLFRSLYPKFYWMGKYKNFQISEHTHTDNFTHWMLLPEPPEENDLGKTLIYTDTISFLIMKIDFRIFRYNDVEQLTHIYKEVIIWANRIALNHGRKIHGIDLRHPNGNDPLNLLSRLYVEIDCTTEEKKNGISFDTMWNNPEEDD